MSLWIIPFASFGNANSMASRYSWTHTRTWCVLFSLSFLSCLFIFGGVLLLSLSLSLSCTLRCALYVRTIIIRHAYEAEPTMTSDHRNGCSGSGIHHLHRLAVHSLSVSVPWC